MRFLILVVVLFLLVLTGQAQPVQPSQSITYSVYSDWQHVTIRPARVQSAVVAKGTYHRAFTADFVTNRNGWKSGKQTDDYQYQIGQGRYTIRKLNGQTTEPAFSFIPLPTNIDLNTTPYYTIKVDMLADSGRVPVGGLVFGVKDARNYTGFTVDEQGDVQIIRVTNGTTSNEYMPGLFFDPKVDVNKNRNRLTIKRTGGLLHFYVNDQEIRSSPYLIRAFSGNSIGMTSSGLAVTFQKLSVTVDQ